MEREDSNIQGLAYAKREVAIQSDDPQEVVDALQDIDNYGVYSKNLSNREAILRTFGPPNPNQKLGAAEKQWATLNKQRRINKLLDIKARYPQVFEEEENIHNERGFQEDFIDYVSNLRQLPKQLMGPKGAYYFPPKTGENMKKYAGVLEPGVNYEIQDDLVVFPSNMENPFESKAYLKKVLETIIKNAGIKAKVVGLESSGDGEKKVSDTTSKNAPLTTTLPSRTDASELRRKMQAAYTIPTAVYKIEDLDNGEAKLIVDKITADQRAKLQKTALEFKSQLSESLRLLKVRAGIIK